MKQSTISRNTCHLKRFRLAFLVLFLVTCYACDEGDDLPFSTSPEIELLGISHDTIREFQDVLIIKIGYQDGDGNLGFEDPDEYALFVRDIRLENFDGFYIGPIVRPDTMVSIQGTLDIEFPSLFIFGNGQSETTRFEVKMIDRNQNESNILETGEVVIVKP